MRARFLLMIGFAIFATCGSTAAAMPSWVSIAQCEVGHGESTGDNRGPDIERYGGAQGAPWCAAFVSYCLRKGGADIPMTVRARDFLKRGTIVKNPRPGDLIVFWRGKNREQGFGHVGIVFRVTSGPIITIEGNSGEFPAKVKICRYWPEDLSKLMGFVRINER